MDKGNPLKDSLLNHQGWSPGIFIKGICGDKYTPESYQLYGELLESFGFNCLKSKPDNEGKYIEVWYLLGLWDAKGELREIIIPEDPKKELKSAVEFLKRKILFTEMGIMKCLT